MALTAFLANKKPRAWNHSASGFQIQGYHLGLGEFGLEVLIASATTPDPKSTAIRSLWKARHAGRAIPLLLVVLRQDGKGIVAGPLGLKDDPPVSAPLEVALLEQVCKEALEQKDKEAALRYLRDALPAVQGDTPGLRNEGFLAGYTLGKLPGMISGWSELAVRAKNLIGQVDTTLLRGLGFELSPLDNLSSLLKASANGSRTAVAVVLQPDESPDLEANRFNGISPVTYAMEKASQENLRYVIVCQGPRVRLYSAVPQIGVASRGRSETFIELHSGLLTGDRAGYLLALLSADALAEGGHFEQALNSSKLYAAEVAKRLRERVYDHVIPALAKGLAQARKIEKPTAAELAETYRMAMTVLFRLLFIAYGEDKKLLPFGLNGLYDKRSLKAKAKELQELNLKGTPFDATDNHWQEVMALFRAVADGNREWAVPEYGGELFEATAEFPLNATLAQLSLSNVIFGPALRELLLTETEHGLAPIDFRTLGVREFGTIYEGLLESELAIAETDLTTDNEGNYRPVKGKEKPIVAKGAIYLHNRSGQRKASGTYFTKPFAVDHLLDEALEPALLDHLKRLDALNDTEAAEAFFDFRVADIAMGSAHFLVAAVDRIERAFSGYLAKRKLPFVAKELADLREAAIGKLGEIAELVDEQYLSETQLLRRQIARRCIYGVDVNPVAVMLARLSIWIHTFVPGLPLSFLNHTLVAGNSLVGVGRIEEIQEAFSSTSFQKRRVGGNQAILTVDGVGLNEVLEQARKPLKEMSRLTEATISDVKKAEKLQKLALEKAKPVEALCDIVTACRITGTEFPFDLMNWSEYKDRIADSVEHQKAKESLSHLPPFHFPVAFPEVFLRDRAGFDVLLGNPPWEKARVEEHGFWARHFPGLRSINQRERELKQAELRKDRPDLAILLDEETAEAASLREALLKGPYPGMGSGDPDLFKAFAWRFWNLAGSGSGRFGVVLPRGALAAKGSELFRMAVFKDSKDVAVTTLVNNRTWVFDNVHPQYTVGLVVVTRGTPGEQSIGLRGPFNRIERFLVGHRKELTRFAASDVLSWTDTASLPLLPSEESLGVFAQLRKHPRLDFDDKKSWRARPYTELHATNDKQLMDLVSEESPQGFWPVYKGESFDLWQPDAGPSSYYAWADPKVVLPELLATQKRGARSKASPFSEFEPKQIGKQELLPCQFPRIAFRDVTRATDSRTMRCALIPPRVFLVHTAPCLLFPRGDATDVAYLLGVLSSLSLDWYARRFVETHMTFGVINPFPIPRPDRANPLRLRVVALAGRLAAVDDRYADWARQVGVECGPLDPVDKEAHIRELDAVVAHLYGLSEAHLTHIFETFHEGWDYHEQLKETLKWYTKWK